MAEYNSWRICGERMEKTFMDMIMLGIGNAMVTNCYNTCFVLRDEKGYFMVDAGLILGYYLIRLLAYKNSPLVFILYFIGFLILFIFADNLVLKWIGEQLLSVHAVGFFIGFAALSAFSFAMQYFAALLIAYKKQRQASKILSEEK